MGALTTKLYDLDSNELADISSITFDPSIKRILSGPRTFQLRSIAGHSLIKTVQEGGDGFPNLWSGNRKLVVWEDGITDPIFHGRVNGIQRIGTGKKTVPVTITAQDATMTELGYQADERGGKPVRDSTGNFINPTFNDGGAISGPDLMKQILTYSQGEDDESGDHPGEGPLPIDLQTGTFDIDVPPAVDLSCEDSMSWPQLAGDFFQQLAQTGVCDFDMAPLTPGTGLNLDSETDPLIMVALTAVSHFGTDLSATIRFAYDTGARNASGIRHLADFKTICNKLYDYLGPRIDQFHWKGNITPGTAGTTVDPTDSRAFYKGQFWWARILDSVGTESSSRPLYIALWNAEQGSRIFPRDLLYITPAKGDYALHEALKDYDVGDDVGVDAGGSLGLDLADSQRVYGYTKTWSRQGVTQVSELLTSADTSYGG